MIFYPCYFQANNEKKPKKCTAKGKLVKSKRIDYANIMWPRDGLYVCYKEQVPFINYVSKEMAGWMGSENGNFCLKSVHKSCIHSFQEVQPPCLVQKIKIFAC